MPAGGGDPQYQHRVNPVVQQGDDNIRQRLRPRRVVVIPNINPLNEREASNCQHRNNPEVAVLEEGDGVREKVGGPRAVIY